MLLHKGAPCSSYHAYSSTKLHDLVINSAVDVVSSANRQSVSAPSHTMTWWRISFVANKWDVHSLSFHGVMGDNLPAILVLSLRQDIAPLYSNLNR